MIVEGGIVVVKVVPGAVETETDERVTVVKLPEMLVVNVKL